MSSNCSACNEKINNIALFAFGMVWHPTCLCCNICGKDFSDGSKVEEGEDGYAYCTKDFINKFSVKCASCNEPIIGQVINAMGKTWHPDHFICNTCKTKLSGQFYSTEDGLYIYI